MLTWVMQPALSAVRAPFVVSALACPRRRAPNDDQLPSRDVFPLGRVHSYLHRLDFPR